MSAANKGVEMSKSTENDVKWTDERLKDLKRTVESYFEKAAAAGRVVSPSGHFSGISLCLVGAVCHGTPVYVNYRQTAAKKLRLTLPETVALEIGFDSNFHDESWVRAMRVWSASPSLEHTPELQALEALGSELAGWKSSR